MIDNILEAIGDSRLNDSECVVMVQADGARSAVAVPEPMEAPEVVAAVQVSLGLSVGMADAVFDKATEVLLRCLRELASQPEEWKRYRDAYTRLAPLWKR